MLLGAPGVSGLPDVVFKEVGVVVNVQNEPYPEMDFLS